MKIAVISDIHSNPDALVRVINDAKERGCESLICLGDIVGYGYDPSACIEILSSPDKRNGLNCDVILMGNHDAALCDKLPIEWFSPTAAAGVIRQRKILTESEKKFLSELPYTYKKRYNTSSITGYYAHGSYVPQKNFFGDEEMFPYMLGSMLPMENIGEMKKSGANNVLFVGHTHERRILRVVGAYKSWATFNKNMTDLTANIDEIKTGFSLTKGNTVINVGSVGYPRIEPFTSYVIFDTLNRTAEFRNLRFDFRGYVENMKKREIPIPSWMHQWYDKESDTYVDEK